MIQVQNTETSRMERKPPNKQTNKKTNKQTNKQTNKIKIAISYPVIVLIDLSAELHITIPNKIKSVKEK